MADYFTTAELRGLPDMSSTVTYPDAAVDSAAAYVTAVVERFVGTSFVPRSYSETYDGGCSSIVLRQAFPIAVSSVSENGVAVAGYTLSYRDGVLERQPTGSYGQPTMWLAGRRNITVAYTAGYATTPPADVKEAAMLATRWHLLTLNAKSTISDRALSITNEMGNISLAHASGESPFGLPEVDAVLKGYRDDLMAYGFA